MKIANLLIVSLVAVTSPVVNALRGARSESSLVDRFLKGDDKDNDDEGDDEFSIPGVDDEILDTTLGDVIDQVLGGDLDLGELGCFSDSTMVQVWNKGSIPMKDLQVGDQVLTSGDRYQAVYAFAHKEVETMANFIQLTTNAGTLEITKDHLIFLHGQNQPVRADAVKVGDILATSTSDAPAPITQIGSTLKQGLYAPLTNDGTIVVDNILASSYVSLQKNTNVVQIQGINTSISQHSFLHMALSPLRMVCKAVHCESYNQQGLAPYVAQGVQFANWAQEQSFGFQLVLLALAFLAFAAFMIIENTMGAPLMLAAVYGIVKANGVSIRKVKTV